MIKHGYTQEYNVTNTMRKGIFLLFIFLGLCNCTQTKYIIIKNSDLIKLDINSSNQVFIPIADKYLSKSRVLDSAINLINNKNLPLLTGYTKKLENSGYKSSDLYLSMTLLNMTRKYYKNAANYVQLIRDSDYPLLKRLLTADINYEVSRYNGSYDFKRLLKDYQYLVDSFPDDSLLKQITAIRIRYLRYKY